MEIDSGLAHLPDLPQAVGSGSMSGETRCRIEKRKRAGSRLRSFLLPSMTARASAQLAYRLTVGLWRRGSRSAVFPALLISGL